MRAPTRRKPTVTDKLVKWRQAYLALMDEAYGELIAPASIPAEVQSACIIAAALIIAGTEDDTDGD